MTAERKHRCGGDLLGGQVQVVFEESDDISFGYRVQGFICNKCREHLIDRETALQLQVSQTPTIVWHPKGVGSTWLDAMRFEPLTAGTPR